MSRESEFRHRSGQNRYGVFGAGAVSRSLIGSLAAHTRQLGPVAAVSFRVASRLANTLKNGYAVRDASELSNSPVILFHAPSGQVAAQLGILQKAALEWTGRLLILCNCQAPPEIVRLFNAKGAAVATMRDFGVAGFVAIHGCAPAVKAALRIARILHFRVVEILPSKEGQFDAGLTLSTAGITPLMHWAAGLLRSAGAREADAAGLAAALVAQTARNYAHSGRQSWEWHTQAPDVSSLLEQIASSGQGKGSLFRELLLLGFDVFARHRELAAGIRDAAEAAAASPGKEPK